MVRSTSTRSLKKTALRDMQNDLPPPPLRIQHPSFLCQTRDCAEVFMDCAWLPCFQRLTRGFTVSHADRSKALQDSSVDPRWDDEGFNAWADEVQLQFILIGYLRELLQAGEVLPAAQLASQACVSHRVRHHLAWRSTTSYTSGSRQSILTRGAITWRTLWSCYMIQTTLTLFS